MRSVWLSPGFPAAPAALIAALGAEYTLAPPLTTPPPGSIAVVTGFERDLLARLASSRPAGTSLVVLTPPDATAPIDEVPGLHADAVVAAASIAEVADALRRLPLPAAAPLAPEGQDLPWWIRPAQDAPRVAEQPPHDTAVFATAPLPAFGSPADQEAAVPTETLALGGEEPARRRFALTGRQARLASIVAVVIAMAATALAVTLDRHSSPAANAAATSGAAGNNPGPFGNSNGSNGFNPFNGQGNTGNSQGNGQGGGSGNGSAPQFGTPGGPLDGQNRSGTRGQEFQQFLACLKQNGVSIDTSQRPLFDPSDPQLRTALSKCSSVLPFGRFRGGFGRSGGAGPGGGASTGTGTPGTNPNSSHST